MILPTLDVSGSRCTLSQYPLNCCRCRLFPKPRSFVNLARSGGCRHLSSRKEQLRLRMHQPIPEQGRWLRQVVTGFFAYHAVPTNGAALSAFRYHVTCLWRRSLRRRSQKDASTWPRVTKLAEDWLPKPKILHP